MTNAHGTSFFLYKKISKCRTPCLENFCKKIETPLKMKQISNMLFLEIIATVVEYPCMTISTKQRRQMKKKAHLQRLLKPKNCKDDECAWNEFFPLQKIE